MNKFVLVVHGGAGDIENSVLEECRVGIHEALVAGWALLQGGGAAIDACEQAVIRLEDTAVFNAGFGAKLNRDGQVQLDAVLMDGARLDAGAVAAVERIRNPVSLARLVMERNEHVFLVGAGAEQFALAHGVHLCTPEELVAPRERSRWLEWKRNAVRQNRADGGTVGAVAIDRHGNLAAATSTGGSFAKHPGRVGDSPILGCGCYADNRIGAASATGEGEAILRVGLSRMALDFVANGNDPQHAVEKALEGMVERTSGKAGLILLDRNGRIGIARTTPRMSAGYRASDSNDFQVLV